MWKLKGIRALPRERLPVLTALYAWRDRKGRELDRPPGRLIANDLLLHVARRAPRDAAALGRLRLRRKLIQEHGEELVETIAAALREPPAPPPKPQRPRPSNAELARTKALQAWRREEAERRELPHHAVLPKRALEWLAANGAHDLQACPELGDKRIARYGGALSKCCAAGASASD
nr:HRDC domain-containing protein [Pseudenhygromyxa sp. WMMC2535]